MVLKMDLAGKGKEDNPQRAGVIEEHARNRVTWKQMIRCDDPQREQLEEEKEAAYLCWSTVICGLVASQLQYHSCPAGGSAV